MKCNNSLIYFAKLPAKMDVYDEWRQEMDISTREYSRVVEYSRAVEYSQQP